MSEGFFQRGSPLNPADLPPVAAYVTYVDQLRDDEARETDGREPAD